MFKPIKKWRNAQSDSCEMINSSEEQLMDCKSWLAFRGTTKSGGWHQSGKRSLLLQNTWQTGFQHCCPPCFTLTVPLSPSTHWFTTLWYGCSHFLTVLPNVEKIYWENVCQVISHLYYASFSVHGPFQAITHFKEAYYYLLRSWEKKHEIILYYPIHSNGVNSFL